MKLVCITGMDGAGKSTLARNVVNALRQQGYRAHYVYGRTYPAVSRLLMALGRALFMSSQDPWKDYGAYSAQKKRTMRNPLLALGYTVAILADYYCQIWLKLLPYLFSHQTVVCDRYVYDTVISDLTVHLHYSSEQTAQAIEAGLRFLPKPSLTFLIDLPEEVAFARKSDMPHLDYLRERRQWYLKLKSRPEVEQIDGQAPPEILVLDVVAKLVDPQRR